MLEWFHFCTILNLQLFFCLTVYFLYMIEETLGFNGHNPVKSQILKVNLVDYLSTGSPDVIHQGVSPHFYWVFHHKEAHLFGWLISWSNLRLWSYWKVKRTRCQTGNSWITWCEVVTTGFAHVYIYIYIVYAISPPWNLTWTLKIDALKRKFSFDTVMFGFRLIFLEYVCMFTYFAGVPQMQFDLSYTVLHFVWQVCAATSKYQHECHGYSFKSVMILYKNSLTIFKPTVTKRSLVLNQNAAFVPVIMLYIWLAQEKVLGATLVLRTCACLSGELAGACEEWSNMPLLAYPIVIDAGLLHEYMFFWYMPW